MPDTLQELFQRNGALDILRVYGLDQILTEEDDPWLWAYVLIHHWPAPWELHIEPAALRFGICRVISESEETVQIARNGMEQIEEWCFERVDVDHLQVRECVDIPKVSFMTMIANATQSALSEPQASLMRDYLDISRPTHNQGKALVHRGISAPPNAGSGETRYWMQKEDGSRVESNEVFFRWLT